MSDFGLLGCTWIGFGSDGNNIRIRMVLKSLMNPIYNMCIIG